MKLKFLKPIILAGIFGLSYLGFTITKSEKRVAGMSVTQQIISVANQAAAYCNEAIYPNERNNGSCTGQMNDSTTRCLLSSSSDCIAGA